MVATKPRELCSCGQPATQYGIDSAKDYLYYCMSCAVRGILTDWTRHSNVRALTPKEIQAARVERFARRLRGEKHRRSPWHKELRKP